MTVIPIYRPYVFLRCRKCGRKTDHVLIDTAATEKGEIEETYECQQCGETKKIYELASLVGQDNMTIQQLEKNIKAKSEAVEQLESKKRELEKRLKEPQRKVEEEQKKDYMEVTLSEAPASSQQPEKAEKQPKNQKQKKKRRFF